LNNIGNLLSDTQLGRVRQNLTFIFYCYWTENCS